MLSWWLGTLIVVFMSWVIVVLPGHGRKHCKRWPGLVSIGLSFVMLCVAMYYAPEEPHWFMTPDNLNNKVLNEFAWRTYQHGGEIFWNPYIFGGMPHFPFMTHNFSVENPFTHWGKWFLIPGIVLLYLYLCLRLKPSEFERKLYRLATSRVDDCPVALIIGLSVWALSWGIRAAIVAYKSGLL